VLDDGFGKAGGRVVRAAAAAVGSSSDEYAALSNDDRTAKCVRYVGKGGLTARFKGVTGIEIAISREYPALYRQPLYDGADDTQQYEFEFVAETPRKDVGRGKAYLGRRVGSGQDRELCIANLSRRANRADRIEYQTRINP